MSTSLTRAPSSGPSCSMRVASSWPRPVSKHVSRGPQWATGLAGNTDISTRLTRCPERCEIWDRGHFVCVLKFDSPLPEDHRVNTLSTADSLRHHCKLGGGSASIPGTSVYCQGKFDVSDVSGKVSGVVKTVFWKRNRLFSLGKL
jgi:hypothetical protein